MSDEAKKIAEGVIAITGDADKKWTSQGPWQEYLTLAQSYLALLDIVKIRGNAVENLQSQNAELREVVREAKGFIECHAHADEKNLVYCKKKRNMSLALPLQHRSHGGEMKSDLDKLYEKVGEWLDESNRWQIPKGMGKSAVHKDSRDFERGAWYAFQFVAGQIRSMKRKKKSP